MSNRRRKEIRSPDPDGLHLVLRNLETRRHHRRSSIPRSSPRHPWDNPPQ
jgi:hypothetical protein